MRSRQWGLDEPPVDHILARRPEQGVDVDVAGVGVRPVEAEVAPVADPGQQLEAEQVGEGVDRVALALGVGILAGGTYLR
jgi:hypothetical protein